MSGYGQQPPPYQPNPYGSQPYGQPPQPYGQPTQPYGQPPQPPYGSPANPYAPPPPGQAPGQPGQPGQPGYPPQGQWPGQGPVAQPVSLRRPALAQRSIPVVTMESFPGRAVTGVLGDVLGVVARSRELPRELRTPNPLDGYATMLTRSRQDAVDRMVEMAEAAGADAVVGLRFDCSEITQTLSEVSAYGTAVTLAPPAGGSVDEAEESGEGQPEGPAVEPLTPPDFVGPPDFDGSGTSEGSAGAEGTADAETTPAAEEGDRTRVREQPRPGDAQPPSSAQGSGPAAGKPWPPA